MKKVIEIITTRRSIRKWKSKEVPKTIIKDLVAAAKSAPSAFNSNSTELIIVEDKKLIDRLLSDRLQMKKPPYYINSMKWAIKGELKNYTKVSLPPLLIAVCGVSKKCPDLCSLVQNMSCSAENILLAAHAGGLGACWLYVYDEEMPKTETEVKRELRIPDNIRVLALIAIGYPNEKPLADNKDLKSYHKDKWGIYER